MATLKELMGDLKRGDGRKFKRDDWVDGQWFEPIFWACDSWYGIVDGGAVHSCTYHNLDAWEPYTKKKVKLYRPIIKEGCSTYWINDWVSNKDCKPHGTQIIVGWQEMEVEVDE